MRASLLLLLTCFAVAACGTEKAKNDSVTIRRFYRPSLLYAVERARAAGSNPLQEATTDAQRKFVAAYMELLRENSPTLKAEGEYRYMEPLRRCGIDFPKGTTVKWTPLADPLMVVHTSSAIKEIEELLGLDPQK